MLTFNPEGHLYFWDGKVVPSVSEILKKIGITRDYVGVDDFYRQRGTYVHQAVVFHVEHSLDEESVDENVTPYLRAFQKYESREGYCVRKTEVPLYSQKYGFAGTLDHLAEFKDSRFPGEGIADLKATEKFDKAADLQLCAYAVLYHENFGKWPAFRLVLELHGDETARPVFFDADPEILWQAVMTLWEWKTTRQKRNAGDAAKKSSGE